MTIKEIKNSDFSTIGNLCENILQEAAEPQKCEFCGKPYKKQTFNLECYNKISTVYCRDCDCYNKEQKKKEKKELEKALREKYERANIGKRYIDITLEKLTKLGTEHVATAKKYVDEFNPESGASLHLIGDFGNGKTSVGYAVLRALLQRNFNGLYITWLDIVNRCYYAKSFDSQEKIDKILHDLSRFDIIVLDELVINVKDDREVNLATELFDRLYRDNKCFVLINNPCDILAMKTVPRLGKLLDRVREQAEKLIFEHSSYRIRNTGGTNESSK